MRETSWDCLVVYPFKDVRLTGSPKEFADHCFLFHPFPLSSVLHVFFSVLLTDICTEERETHRYIRI